MDVGLDDAELAALVAVALVVLVPFLGFALLGNIVMLIASIVGIRNAERPERLGRVFGWALVGAIVAGLSGSWVTMVLFIIICVYAEKDKHGELVPEVSDAPLGV